MPFTYHTTQEEHTIEPHVYIGSYKDEMTQKDMHAYKFSHDRRIMHEYVGRLVDLCIAQGRNHLILGSPPSTMFERGEKKVDSVFELLKATALIFSQFAVGVSVRAKKIFSIRPTYLKQKKAQHLGGTRKSRLKDLDSRYGIRLGFRLYILCCIRMFGRRHISFILIDDVSTTGATLVSSRNALSRHMSMVQGKYPKVTYEIRIFSLAH